MNAAPTIHFRHPQLVRRAGDPFQVNSATPGAQWQAKAATLAGGGFVVTWHNEPDDVRAQLFDASGARIGAEIVVNTQDSGLQATPAVAALSGGGFVVSWLDTNGDAGTGISGSWSVKAQFFSSAGDKTGPEILVNTAIDGVQDRPTICALANGNVLIVWEDSSQGVGGAGGDASGIALKGQLFAGDGSRIGGELLINTTTQGDQVRASVEALPEGGFAIVWTDRSRNGNGAYEEPAAADIRAQLFDAAGARAGPEILLNALEPRVEDGAVVTALANGNLLVLWHDHGGSEARLRGQILDPTGAKIGGVELAPGPQLAFNYSAVALAGGGFVVAWDDGASGDHLDVGAQLFGADGARIGAEVSVDDGGPYDYLLGLAAFANGEIAILYTHQDANGAATWAQLYDSGLGRIGEAVPASPFYGGLAVATPDGRMLLLSATGEIDGQLLALAPQLCAIDTIPLDLKGEIMIGDADAGGGILIVTLSAPSGILTVTAGGSGAAVSGNGTGQVAIAGTLAQIEALLSSDPASVVAFTADYAPDTSLTLTVTVDDNGDVATAGLTLNAIQPAIQDGTAAADVLAGSPGEIDILHGLAGNDLLYGEDRCDVLFGDDGNDYLIGGAGNDVMHGGNGSDTYYVDSLGDVVDEAVGEGIDRVAASISYTLAPGAEVETLEAVNLGATDAMNLTGNKFGQTIIGNDGVNILRGEGGDDALIGLGGDDYLVGGTGIDVMYGGVGNDTYYVDAAGDVVGEAAGEGLDRVAASASYALLDGAEVELLEAVTPSASDAMDLTGNEFAQTVAGNNGANILRGEKGNDTLFGYGGDDYLVGGTGNDVMDGGAGSDTFYVDSQADVVIEAVAPGVDRVATQISYTLAAGAHIEVLEAITLADTAAMNLTGNEFGQAVIGNSGSNLLDGKGGNDLLIGADGADAFAFTTALGPDNVDRVADFAIGKDKIVLEDAVFTGLPVGALAAGAFVIGTQALDDNDRIIYNPNAGQLFFDADGKGGGAPVLFATVDGHPPLTASDFIVI